MKKLLAILMTLSMLIGNMPTLAEPGALIAFTGPRVIEQTIHKSLPDGFQRSEFLLEHGFVDRIAPRGEQRDLIGRLLKLHAEGDCQ